MECYVEVLLASYNGAKFIEAQIDSILAQSHQNLHLIINDDGSSDDTRKLIKKKMQEDSRINLLPQGKNRGVIQNFSYLMEQTKADYIMLADQDDVWLPNKVEKTLKKLLEMEQAVGKELPILVHTDLKVVDEKLSMIAPSFCRFAEISPKKRSSLYYLLGQNVVTGCTVMINRSLLKRALPIPKETIMHDWWLALVASSLGEIGYIDEATMLYRQHTNNQLGAKSGQAREIIWRALKEPQIFLENNRRIIKKQKTQALTLLTRYSSTLAPERLEQVNAFIEILEAPLLKKLTLMRRFGSPKQGILKSTGSLLISILRNDQRS